MRAPRRVSDRQVQDVGVGSHAHAGRGAVAACGCVPAIPKTQAYVARVLGLMAGWGDVAAPTLEVRLVD